MPRFHPTPIIQDCWSSIGNITFYHRNGQCFYKRKINPVFPGGGFTWRNLYNYRDFFDKHPQFFLWNGTESEPTLILHAVSAKSGESADILHALSAKTPIRLSWTHYRIILQELTLLSIIFSFCWLQQRYWMGFALEIRGLPDAYP